MTGPGAGRPSNCGSARRLRTGSRFSILQKRPLCVGQAVFSMSSGSTFIDNSYGHPITDSPTIIPQGYPWCVDVHVCAQLAKPGQ